jgi:hypothetical protein
MPQRWALILSVAAGVALALGTTTNAAVGVSIATALAMLLHNMLE